MYVDALIYMSILNVFKKSVELSGTLVHTSLLWLCVAM